MISKKEKTTYGRTREEWRAWLEKNHTKEKKVGLIKYKKHTGKPSLTHKESMEEAICFGWIDTTIKRLDDDRYMRYFARRTPKSNWSTATRRYARELIAAGRMTPEGLRAYKAGLKRKTLDYGIPKNPSVPEDLQKELKNVNLYEAFMKFAPSYRRTYLRWIEKAKQPKTRKKRIAAVVERARTNQQKWQI